MSQSGILALGEHIEERERVARAARVVRLLCAGVVAACVALAGGLLLPRLNEKRADLELIYKDYEFQNAPPSVSLPSPMLATFRGVLIHALWPRAEELKSEAKYYELQQLSDWICNLQPRFPKAWEYSAWNMAYNISVGTYSPRERWHWVYAGAKLLRDRGLVYNPKTINLYHQLAWIYLHKMGDFMDDHHWRYKKIWAVMMERVLGQPPPEGTAEQVLAWFRPIAEAAVEMSEIGPVANPETLKVYIERDNQGPSMADAVSRLRALDRQPDADFLELVARYQRRGLRIEDLVLAEAAPEEDREAAPPEETDPLARFKALMTDEKMRPALDRLLAAVRAHELAAEYKLDAEMMLDMMEEHGPLDWRSVYSHGYYWAALGSDRCKGVAGVDENVEMNTDRFVQFGLKDSFERNRLVFDPDFDEPFDSYIQLLPDTRFVERLHEVYLEHAEKHQESEDQERYYQEGPAGRLFAPGHVNFLHNAIKSYYLEGDLERAQQYYDYCRKNYTERDGRPKEQYFVPLDDFVFNQFADDVESFRRSGLVIDLLLQRGFLSLAHDRPTTAARQLALARRAHEAFMKDKQLDRTDRRKLPPWEEYLPGSFARFLLSSPIPLHLRARAWQLMDNDAKLRIYREIESPMAQFCAGHEPRLDPAKAFPPPAGLEEYEQQLAQPPKKDLQPGEQPDVQEAEVSEGEKR